MQYLFTIYFLINVEFLKMRQFPSAFLFYFFSEKNSKKAIQDLISVI